MSDSKRMNRRDMLSIAGVAGAAMGMSSLNSTAADETAKPGQAAEPAPTKRDMPIAKLGDVEISRLMLGGNLIGGWMHSRDLKYVNSLFRAYATEEKMIETLHVAYQNGINTVFETGANYVRKYNEMYGADMKFIPHIKVDRNQSEEGLKQHIATQVETGAAAVYVWGVSGDTLVRAGDIDLLGKAVEIAKTHGVPVGVGSHSLRVPMACEKEGVPCDFYVKTLHSDQYPSATPKEQRREFMWLDGNKDGWYDNMWCIDPEETIAFMEKVEKPWVAFKVLAAGAFLPHQGFSYAFEAGADIIAVGMLDFQIEANAKLVPRLVQREENRKRPWRA